MLKDFFGVRLDFMMNKYFKCNNEVVIMKNYIVIRGDMSCFKF